MEGALFAWIPTDVRIAALLAIIVAFAALYEFAPLLAAYLYFALAGVVVVLTVND
jgi:hypothetical protein